MIRSTICLAALLASTAQASTSELPTKIVRDLQETNPHAAPKPQCFYSYKMGEDMVVRAGLCLQADPSLEEGSAGTVGLLPACKPGKDEEDNPIPTLHCPDAGYDMLSKMISRDVISGHAFAICSSEDSPALHLGKGSYPEETAWFQAVPLRAQMTDDSIVSADGEYCCLKRTWRWQFCSFFMLNSCCFPRTPSLGDASHLLFLVNPYIYKSTCFNF